MSAGISEQGELKSMVLRFRVTELHSLMKFLSIRITGRRKRDLQKKALHEIERRYTSLLSKKIRKMYKKMMGHYDELLPSDLEDCVPSVDYLQEGQLSNFISNYYSSDTNSDHQFRAAEESNCRKFVFKDSAFYKYQADIMAIKPLNPCNHNSYVCDVSFNLNKEYLKLINSAGSRYKTLLRFCVLSDQNEVFDQLPPMVAVRVNYNFCSLPSTSSSTKRCTENCPIDITPYIHTTNTLNFLSLEWAPDYRAFAVTIQLVQKYSSDDLIENLKSKRPREASISKRFISDCLKDDGDGIATTSLKMSLVCPLGKVPITLPVRATTCSHLQCFDGAVFVKMNELKSTWQCPICHKPCAFHNLFIDGYFVDILKSERFKSCHTEIIIFEDGSWQPVQETANCKTRPDRKSTKHTDVDLEPSSIISLPSATNAADLDVDDTLHNFFNNLVDRYYGHEINRRTETECSKDSPTKMDRSIAAPVHSDSSSSDKKILLVDLTIDDSSNSDTATVARRPSSSPAYSSKTISPAESDSTVRSPTPSVISSRNNSPERRFDFPAPVRSSYDWIRYPTKYAPIIPSCNSSWNSLEYRSESPKVGLYGSFVPFSSSNIPVNCSLLSGHRPTSPICYDITSDSE